MPAISTFSNATYGVNDKQPPKPPQTEVTPRPKRRTLTAAYKLRILAEADACTEPGQVGALLRREGLYSSSLTRWRRQRRKGQLQGLTPKKRGPKPSQQDEMARELEQLRRQKAQLEERLAKAETIIEVQKKLSTLLGLMPQEPPSNDSR